MSKKCITIWESWSLKNKCWMHNHIENGWSKDDIPKVKTDSKEQKSWKGQKWNKEFGWLIDSVVLEKI